MGGGSNEDGEGEEEREGEEEGGRVEEGGERKGVPYPFLPQTTE